MKTMTPRRAYLIGMRTMLASGPIALLMLGSWGLRLHWFGTRPQLLMMLYLLFLLVAVGGFCVMILAACHAAIHRAFGHGYLTGVQVAGGVVRESHTPDLHVVE